MPTQATVILAHLQAGHTLTPLEAWEMFGCLRLAARIYDLRQAGHDVHEEMVTVGRKSFARYWLPRCLRQLRLDECPKNAAITP